MSEIGQFWAGRVYGTNTGNVFLEFKEIEPKIIGTLRFLDSAAGIAVYAVEGTFDDKLRLVGQWKQGGQPEDHGKLEIVAQLTAEGYLRGKWSSTVGTGGTFELFPHDIAAPTPPRAGASSIPEQIYTRNVSLGALRLYAEDVVNLLQYVQEEFNTPRPIVTYHVRGSEVTKYAADFIREASSLGKLSYLKITVQEPEAHGINRLVIVEINSLGSNEIRVQGVRESWVIGRAESLATHLRRFESGLVTTYRKFGLNLNSLIFIAMLILIPELSDLIDRTIFVVSTFALLLLLLGFHSKFIPNATIFLTDVEPSLMRRTWPTILSWVGAVTASLAAALVFQWLSNGGP